MTWQQFNNAERLISARKLKEIRRIGEGRGRKLKTADLTTILLYAFGEYDAEEDEAYPRLTTGTLYRAMDNVTTMKAARDIILSLGPSSFKISLSFCYNYTGRPSSFKISLSFCYNYTGRPSSFKISLSFCYNYTGRQAIQHHHGSEVNAPISLKVILKAHGSFQHVPTPQSFICCGIWQAGNTLNNFTTSWMDMYSTTIYSMIANCDSQVWASTNSRQFAMA